MSLWFRVSISSMTGYYHNSIQIEINFSNPNHKYPPFISSLPFSIQQYWTFTSFWTFWAQSPCFPHHHSSDPIPPHICTTADAHQSFHRQHQWPTVTSSTTAWDRREVRVTITFHLKIPISSFWSLIGCLCLFSRNSQWISKKLEQLHRREVRVSLITHRVQGMFTNSGEALNCCP